jgi:hypothetical protein
MSTYIWNVISISAIPQLNNEINVVVEIIYSVSNGIVSMVKKQNIDYNQESAFTPFSSLTESQVIGWVQAALKSSGVTAVQDAVDAMLVPVVLPTDVPVFQDLPWAPKINITQTNLA